MLLILKDPDPTTCGILHRCFWDLRPNVVVESAGVLEAESRSASCVVWPVDEQGLMDPTRHMQYVLKFGWRVLSILKAQLVGDREDGAMPQGKAVVVKTADTDIPFCVFTSLSESNPQTAVAFRAALRAIRTHNAFGGGVQIGSILSPILGRLDGLHEALEMRVAWDDVFDEKGNDRILVRSVS